MNVIVVCLIYFLAAATPGPSQVFILERALTRSRLEAKWAALGVSLGTFIWVAMVLWGLQSIVHYLPNTRLYIRYLCVGLLFFFVVRNTWALMMTRAQAHLPRKSGTQQLFASGRTSFMQGVLVNVLNPNSVVFFMTLFAPLMATGISEYELALCVVGVMIISIVWYQLLAELARFNALYNFLKEHAVYFRILITMFYFYWAIKLLRTA